jgi:hypothetical protein
MRRATRRCSRSARRAARRAARSGGAWGSKAKPVSAAEAALRATGQSASALAAQHKAMSLRVLQNSARAAADANAADMPVTPPPAARNTPRVETGAAGPVLRWGAHSVALPPPMGGSRRRSRRDGW